MRVFSLSPIQLARVWSELEQCFYKDHCFGTDTCELYAYRLTDNSPTSFLGRGKFAEDAQKEDAEQAAVNLYHILLMFKEMRQVNITVDERDFGSWILEQPFYHRAHVKISRAEKDD